jgi:hypothetical protein
MVSARVLLATFFEGRKYTSAPDEKAAMVKVLKATHLQEKAVNSAFLPCIPDGADPTLPQYLPLLGRLRGDER